MEAYRNKPEYYVAEGDVRFIRNDFYSKCGRAVYYKDNESVSLSKEPVVWQENMQMTGDSIFAELPENKLQSVFVRKIPELKNSVVSFVAVSYTHLRAHETVLDIVCRLLLEKKNIHDYSQRNIIQML